MGKSLMKNSIYNILYKVVTALYPLFAVTYVSHILLAEKMGMVSYAQNIVSYFAVIAALGIPTYGIREIAVRSNNKNKRSQVFWELFIINFISTTISIVIYLVLIFSVNRFLENKILYEIAGLQIFFNYLNVDWFYQGMEEYKYISLRSIIVKLVSLIALPLTIHSQDDYLWYAMIYCLAIGGNNIFNIIRIRKYICKPRKKIQVIKHLKSIAILLMVSIAVEIYAMIDTTMLGIFCDDQTVGCYSNAMKLTRMVNTMAAAIGAVLFPRLSVIFNNNDKREFNELVNKGIKIMLVIAFPAAVGMIVCSHSIITIFFGNSFAESVPILKILAFMIPVVVCNTLLGGQVLVTTNQEDKYVITVIIASAVNVILNALFIPKFGATSAAIASLISEIIDIILYLYFARKYVKINISAQYIMSVGIPLLLYIMISKVIISPLELGNFWSLSINIIVCVILYFPIGYIMKNEAIIFAVNKVKSMI